MKDFVSLVKALAVGAACLVFLGACNGGSSATDPVDTPTAPPETPTAVLEAPTATPEPAAPEVTDQDLIDAALAAQEASPAPEGTIAWDVLETDVTEDGTVRFRLCTWDGLTAFDEVRDVRYRTTVADGGTITATNIQDSVASGDCLNTRLIETAVETVDTYDQFWRSNALEPANFATDSLRLAILTDKGLADHTTLSQQWTSDDVVVQGLQAGRIEESLVAPLLTRSYNSNNGAFLELATCRLMDDEYGIYRNELLLDDLKGGTINGPHAIAAYTLKPDRDSPHGWRVDLTDTLVWGDCFRTDDWPGAVNDWKPTPVEWMTVGPPYAS